jgi:hypothetical protein
MPVTSSINKPCTPDRVRARQACPGRGAR